MHSKYDNMHKNRTFNALNCINNYVIITISCMLSMSYLCNYLGKIIFFKIVKDFFSFSLKFLVRK